MGGKFGMSLRLVQSRVKVPQGLRGYSFLPSDDDEDDVDEETTVKVEIGSDGSEDGVVVNSTQDAIDNVESSDDGSSDDGSSDDDDDEEEPPPPKKTKKGKA